MNPRQQLRQHSLRSLAHPISIGAIVLLLVNDHWLRWRYPSWWSGKIGDFAWLIFAPILLAWCLSFVWPKKKIHQVGKAAFISTGLVFVLGNSAQIFHQWVVWLFQQIAGWNPMMILDPTDLLMLPGLIVGWKIWQLSITDKKQKLIPLQKNLFAWLMLSIGALATMANGPSYDDFGVYCVAQQGETILAVTGSTFVSEEGWYESTDGGITWTKFNNNDSFTEPPCKQESIPWHIESLNTAVHWRIKEAGESIEQSLDAGQSWRTVYEFPAGEQVRKYYYRPEPQNWGPQGRVVNPGGPYNGVVDQTTGNLIVSMGFEGVIVITPAGEVNRIGVGPYSFVDINELSLAELLSKEFVLAIILGLLDISIASIPFWTKSRSRTAFLVMLVAGTAVWLIYILFSKEAGVLILLSLVLFSIWGPLFYAILAGIAVQKIIEKHSWRLVGQLLATAIITVLLFIIPLVFWARGWVQSYQLVIVISIVLALLPIGHSYNLVSNKMFLDRRN